MTCHLLFTGSVHYSVYVLIYHLQELIQVTKRKMVATIQEKIRRLHEEKIVAELTKGAVLYDVKMSSGIGHVPIPSLPITQQGFYACVTVVSLCVTHSISMPVPREWFKEEKEEQRVLATR